MSFSYKPAYYRALGDGEAIHLMLEVMKLEVDWIDRQLFHLGVTKQYPSYTPPPPPVAKKGIVPFVLRLIRGGQVVTLTSDVVSDTTAPAGAGRILTFGGDDGRYSVRHEPVGRLSHPTTCDIQNGIGRLNVYLGGDPKRQLESWAPEPVPATVILRTDTPGAPGEGEDFRFDLKFTKGEGEAPDEVSMGDESEEIEESE